VAGDTSGARLWSDAEQRQDDKYGRDGDRSGDGNLCPGGDARDEVSREEDREGEQGEVAYGGFRRG
jgi:hypothetical protein